MKELADENSRLRSKIGELEAEMKALEDENQVLSEEISKERAGLIPFLEAKDAQHKELESSFNQSLLDLNAEIIKKDEGIKNLITNKGALEVRINELELAIKALEHENQQAQKEISEKKCENLQLAEELASYKENLRICEQEKSRLICDKAEIQKLAESNTKGHDAQAEELKKLKAEIQQSLLTKADLEEKVQSLEDSLNEQNLILQKQEEIVLQQKEQMDLREKTINAQMIEISSSEKIIRDKGQRIEELTTSLNAALSQLDQTKQELLVKIETINGNEERINKMVANRKQQTEIFETEIKLLKDQIIELEKHKTLAEKQEEYYLEQISQLEEANKTQRAQQELQLTEERLKSQQNAEESSNMLSEKVKAQENEIKKMSAAFSNSETERELLKKRVNELESECEALRQGKESEQKNIDSKSEQQLLARVTELSQEKEELEATVEKFKLERKALSLLFPSQDEDEFEEATDKSKVSGSKKENLLEDAYKFVADTRNDMLASNARIEQSQAQINELKAEIDELKAYQNQLESTNDAMKNQIKEEQNDLFERINATNKQIDQLALELARVIESSGLKVEMKVESADVTNNTGVDNQGPSTELQETEIQSLKKNIEESGAGQAVLLSQEIEKLSKKLAAITFDLSKLEGLINPKEALQQRSTPSNEALNIELFCLLEEEVELRDQMIHGRSSEVDVCIKAIRNLREKLKKAQDMLTDEVNSRKQLEKELEGVQEKISRIEKEKLERLANWKALSRRLESGLGIMQSLSTERLGRGTIEEGAVEMIDELALQELIVSRIENMGEIFENFEHQFQNKFSKLREATKTPERTQRESHEEEDLIDSAVRSVPEDEVNSLLVMLVIKSRYF